MYVAVDEKEDAVRWLCDVLSPGDTVYTVLRHVSSSGLTRAISLFVARNDEILDISYFAAKALGLPLDRRHGGVRISGCGMDMGFELVHSLGRLLWPQGFRTPAGYLRNGPADYEPDGGYALRHKWL